MAELLASGAPAARAAPARPEVVAGIGRRLTPANPRGIAVDSVFLVRSPAGGLRPTPAGASTGAVPA
ncbi:hypothetical protein [Phycisphaera mikurensis]|uniref:Uncharacterized protein n=1 Tax=Phycisphaera mikurensis (strain NBRC 102666 / KCTC 22515 / FYK2301M01) TaxID=1142394 RepID=I0IB57_PHYMF|nr:hypothetical protein [Phycisphaera mikurensis]MBB6442995.1 hypothetical protein [Phycisphaera mikurensis]BAM02495.1 hypothetical protein PSMK_03360 [Phycisphaera mikurensis NBRC 102666]